MGVTAMNNTQRIWFDLKNGIIRALEAQEYDVISCINAWNNTYRPLIIETLSKSGDYSITIGDRVIEWSVRK
jgi:hypothetical protein